MASKLEALLAKANKAALKHSKAMALAEKTLAEYRAAHRACVDHQSLMIEREYANDPRHSDQIFPSGLEDSNG
mgnify:CR=1 FL=1